MRVRCTPACTSIRVPARRADTGLGPRLCIAVVTALLGLSASVQAEPPAQPQLPPRERAANPAALQMQGRCLRVAPAQPGGPKTAFERQLCLHGTQLDPDGSLRVAVRYAQKGSSQSQGDAAPTLRLLREGRPQGATGQSRYEELKTPVDVVVVVMMAKPTPEVAGFASGLQHGLLALMEETYRIPGSRFGLLGYSDSATEFAPRLPSGDGPLLEQAQSDALRTAVAALQLQAGPLSEPRVQRAVLSAYDLFGLGRGAPGDTEPRRRHLVLFSNSFDYDPDPKFCASLMRHAVHDGVTVTLISPPRYTNAVKPELAPLIDGTGGLIYATRDAADVERAFRQVGSELRRQLTVSFRLDASPRPREALKLGLALTEDARSSIYFVADAPELTSLPPALQPSRPHRSGPILLMLVSALGALGTIGVFWLWLMRQPLGVLQELRFGAGSSRPRPAAPGARVWLHWVDLNRDILLEQFPHSIGNDLDCDTVLFGVGAPKKRCEIRHDPAADSLYLVLHDRDGVQYGEAPLTGPLKLEDGMELLINKQRFKLFITQLGSLESGGKS